MLGKIRRNSKQLFETRQKSITAVGSIPESTQRSTSTTSTGHRKLTFFDLPAEIRNVIYEDAARDTSIFLPSTSNRNGKKATTVGKLGTGVGPIPSLLVVSRLTRREYLPLLLQFAHVKVQVKDFDFRNLIRLLSSLYAVELKSLRQNTNLVIQLAAEKCNRDSIVSLRRWLDNRASGLDRIPWGYAIYWRPRHQILPTTDEVKRFETYQRRRDVLQQNLEAIAQLDKNVHENLQFELRPIIAAFENEEKYAPTYRDSGRYHWSTVFRAPSAPVCSV